MGFVGFRYFDGFLSTPKLILGFDLNLDQIRDQSIGIFFFCDTTQLVPKLYLQSTISALSLNGALLILKV